MHGGNCVWMSILSWLKVGPVCLLPVELSWTRTAFLSSQMNQLPFNTYIRLNPEEVYVKTLYISLELRVLIEDVLLLLEGVLVSPVVQPSVQVVAVEPVFEAHAFQRGSERAMVLQAIPKILDHL